MTLFRAKDAGETLRARRTERKATKSDNAARAYANSPHFQRVVEENKQLRAAIHRISALEKRADDTEAWQAEAQPRIESALNTSALPTVPNVQCHECHESYPNYPVYWPGGFHGSREPICAYCKLEREYLK
jgi:hypothetical protein